LSRVWRGGAGATVEPARWKTAGREPESGLREYRPRRVDAQGRDVPEPPPEPAPPAETAPPAPPPPDLDRIRKEAFQEGYEAGEEAGAARAEKGAAERLAELGRVVDQIAGYKAALRAEAARETVELAFAVARRVVRRELSVDPRMTAAMVKACLDEYPDVDPRRVRVHPSAAAGVREQFGETFEVIEDDDVPPGGAVLETAQGRLDARIDTQLEEIERGLTDR